MVATYLTEPILTKWGVELPARALSVSELKGQRRLLAEPELFTPGLPKRVLDKIVIGGSFYCWEWQASKDKRGYGRVYDETRKGMVPAHRYIFSRLLAPIDPPQLTVDHMCRNRGCVWPGHLILMSRENNIRMMFKDRYHIWQPTFEMFRNLRSHVAA
jgi:hypothetical protein